MLDNLIIIQCDSTVIILYSKDHKGVGMAHEINQPQFAQTTMRQYWLGKTKPKQASGRPEILSTICYRIVYLMEFSSN